MSEPYPETWEQLQLKASVHFTNIDAYWKLRDYISAEIETSRFLECLRTAKRWQAAMNVSSERKTLFRG